MAMGPGIDINQLISMFGGPGAAAANPASGGGFLSWLGNLAGGAGNYLGSEGFGNTLNGLMGLGGLMGGQNFGLGGLLGMLGGGGFGGLQGNKIPKSFTFNQSTDVGQRLRDLIQALMPQQFAHEQKLQGGMTDLARYLQDSAEKLGMSDIELRRALGMAGIDVSKMGIESQERLGKYGIGSQERLGMRGFESDERRAQMIANAMSSIFGGSPMMGGIGASGMTAGTAPSTSIRPMAGTPTTSGQNALGGGDYFSDVENKMNSEYGKETSISPGAYRGIAARANAPIRQQAARAAMGINSASQRNGLGFNAAAMNRQAQAGMQASGDLANRMADAEVGDRMERSRMRPEFLRGLAGIAGQRLQNRQFMQGSLLPWLNYM